MNGFLDRVLFQPEPILWVQRVIGAGHPLPFRLIDLLASTWGVLFAIALALWVWGREDAYALAAIVVAEAAVNLALNQLFAVPRPNAPEIIKYEQVALGSFPSGHVFTATVLWGLLWARGRVPLWLSALVVVGVGAGRLYLGVHYLADVMAGVALGALLVWAFQALWPAARGWLGRHGFGWFATVGVLIMAAVGAGMLWMGSGNHFMWNAAAIAFAAVPALLLEWRKVRFVPAPPRWPRVFTKVLIGMLGIVPLLVVDRATGEQALYLGAAMVGAATLWALLGAPALFQAWGWGEPRARGEATAGAHPS